MKTTEIENVWVRGIAMFFIFIIMWPLVLAGAFVYWLFGGKFQVTVRKRPAGYIRWFRYTPR